jgi:cobalt/nickel transport system permease protein
MINTIAGIDYHASAGRTLWHRASALTKLLLAALLIGCVVFTPSLRLLIVLHAVAWILALSGRVPFRLLRAAAGYPLLFCAVLAIATWNGHWIMPLRLVLRPLTASLTAVWLVATTPYPDLFAPISRVLPRTVGDGLFLTYRALFDLIARTERLWRALRLRGGSSVPVRRRLTFAGEGLGTLVLYGFERSQRLYSTMLLRGHSGRICGCRHYAELGPADLAVGATALASATIAILLWRTP